MPRMLAVLAPLGVEAVHHDNAPDFLAWLDGNVAGIDLLTLDHDLGPTRPRGEARFDPGTGMDVVEWLERARPGFPVIVHSSNPYAVPAMLFRLERAGVRVQRVVPAGEDWVETSWAATVRECLRA